MDWLSRERSLIGDEAVEKLKSASVIVFGIGGVGGYAVEALARAGVGHISVVDHDIVSETNINRQIVADTTTIGRFKVDVIKERILKINPSAIVDAIPDFVTADNIDSILSMTSASYLIDAIDTVTSKLDIAEAAMRLSLYIISSMGTGNKLDPSRFKISDISKTNTCPLAKVMRHELKTRNILHLPVVFSDELPLTTHSRPPASISFVPPAAGFLLSSAVIKIIICGERDAEDAQI